MKINTLLLFITGLVLTSCFDSPNFPDVPKIKFENIVFKEVGTNTDADSLIMTIHFEDGDGDLGLDDSFTDAKFREGDFHISPTTGRLITTQYLDSPSYDLPPYEIPYSCNRWLEKPTFSSFCALAGIPSSECTSAVQSLGLNTINTDQSKIILDTLLFTPNPDRSNYFLTFLIETSADQFEEFDWFNNPKVPDPCAINFSLTFPPISDNTKSFPSEGELRFSYTANRIPTILGDKRLKVRIKIKDRALHESNTVESPPFTIEEIRVN